MSKVAVVYWSGTGNTQAMAEAVKSAIGADLFEADAFDADLAAKYDAFAFGCPAMGSEVLEEDVFDPMFTQIEGSLSGKKAALFGSYGWGDGEWMRNWEDRCREDGIELVHDSVICLDAPDDDTLEALKDLAHALEN